MPNYRRNRVVGGTYFFTVNLLDRRSDLLVTRIGALRDAVRGVRARSPFHIDAWVVLPDHMHCLWTLPDGDADFPGRWRAIKIAFSKSLPVIEPRSPVRLQRGERGIWQRRYWEHTIRDDLDYAVHMDYIHFNPVKHGLAQKPADCRCRAFGAAWREGSTRWIGSAAEPNCLGRGSGCDEGGGMRCAFPPTRTVNENMENMRINYCTWEQERVDRRFTPGRGGSRDGDDPLPDQTGDRICADTQGSCDRVASRHRRDGRFG